MITMCADMGIINLDELTPLEGMEVTSQLEADFSGSYADGQADEEKIKIQLLEVAIKLADYADDTSEEIDAFTNQGIGMMLMAIELGIATKNEIVVLMDYAVHNNIDADFYDAFIDGTYRNVPVLDFFENPFF